MQDKQTTNTPHLSDIVSLPSQGRILAFDIGTKKIGVAVCDELQMLVRPLKLIRRIKWKLLILEIAALVEEFDAVAVVMGLPYEYDGSESEMSADVRKLRTRLSEVVSVPVFLQDERLTTKSAQQDLHDRGFSMKEILERIDAEAAAIILEDFLALKEHLRNFG